ncbi:hypothetical protein [Mangrovicoccus algicola]|uniref:SGNH/GDSL hydrolase family protein n=1 Tax=Mangrovicoccus algicola TaxID=2771008 RepID=A0A8J6YXN4_9RHOB|nr:hypothetical protein [Mangrovicoccus algicola]MBE3637718.1 hypothetical protein [Mangrovicoccus algicola]
MEQITLRRLAAPVLLAWLSGGAVMAEGPAPEVRAPQAENPSRVLLVGNSYLYYSDSLHNHVRRMVMADDDAAADRLQYKSATIGGARLRDHDIDRLTTPGAIGVAEPFELVMLQGHSGAALSEKNQQVYRDAVVAANEVIRDRGGHVAIYMPHAYVAPHKSASPENTGTNDAFYTGIGNELDALVVPVGLAFEEAYRRRPEMALQQHYDGSHPTLLGSYLAAATVYATLYGANPVGNDYDYFGNIGAEDAAFLQEVARDTVAAYQSR